MLVVPLIWLRLYARLMSASVHSLAISFLVQQKFIKFIFTKSLAQHTVTVFSSRVSCEPIVTICLNLGSWKRHSRLSTLQNRNLPSVFLHIDRFACPWRWLCRGGPSRGSGPSSTDRTRSCPRGGWPACPLRSPEINPNPPCWRRFNPDRSKSNETWRNDRFEQKKNKVLRYTYRNLVGSGIY